jgi:hypothetical protein
LRGAEFAASERSDEAIPSILLTVATAVRTLFTHEEVA